MNASAWLIYRLKHSDHITDGRSGQPSLATSAGAYLVQNCRADLQGPA